MSNGQHHTNWGVEDFQRYHSGKMTEAEMHALEKAALDDPFLEDALEGYAFTPTPVADISELKEKLWPAPAEETPVVWFKRKPISQLFRAAAVLIIFAGLGWLFFNNYQSKAPDEKAKEIASVATKTPTGSVEPAPVFDLSKDSIPTIARLDDQPSTKGITNIGTLETKIDNQPSTNDNIHTPAEADDLARNESGAKDKATIKIRSSVASPQKASPLPSREEVAAAPTTAESDRLFYKNQQTTPSQSSELKGRVVDQNGQAVPFATVRNATDKRQVTNADAQGNFALQNNTVASNSVPVEINAAGYDSKQASLNNNSTNTVVLNEQEQKLSEVVVTDGYGAKSRKKEKYQWNGKNSLIQLRNAVPLEGWAYFYYVMNDSIVNNHLFNKEKGKIVFQFDVDSAGTVKNIIVKNSLNDSADNAAMRILLKSPVLKITDKKKKPEASIKFNY